MAKVSITYPSTDMSAPPKSEELINAEPRVGAVSLVFRWQLSLIIM
jgi:hypothetical protein